MKTRKYPPPVPADTCPTCGKTMKRSRASLSLRIYSEEVPVRGIPHLRCPACDERLIGLEAAKELRLQAHDRYREKHGLLSPTEIQALRDGLSLTQAQLADLLQLEADTLSRWEADRLVQSPSMDILLRLIRDVPQNLRYLQEPQPDPRGDGSPCLGKGTKEGGESA